MSAKNTIFRWVRRLFLLTVLVAGAGYAKWRWTQTPVESPTNFKTAVISRGKVVQSVTANGQINPVVQVEVGSQISGIIQKLFADFNSTVTEGELLAQIDPATYEANAIQAEGNLATAKAALELAQINARRTEELAKNRLVPQSEHDSIMAALHKAEAEVRISEGSLKKTKVDLARCQIHAPISGTVISRDVSVGQTVAASLSAPKLFVIVNDLSQMQIAAKISEADIGRIQSSQDVKFTVDAFPGESFLGEVTQVRNAPLLDQNVVMYDTIINVKNPDLKLKPGMTANVSIVVAQHDDVVKVPNAALRFKPPKGMQGKKDEVATAAGQGEKKTDVEKSAKDEKKPGDEESPSQQPGEKKSDGTKSKKDKKKSEPELASASGQGEKKAEEPKPKKEKKKSEKTVYQLKNGELRAVQVKVGLTDGRETEIIDGLNEGDQVVVEMAEVKESPALSSRLAAVFKMKKD